MKHNSKKKTSQIVHEKLSPIARLNSFVPNSLRPYVQKKTIAVAAAAILIVASIVYFQNQKKLNDKQSVEEQVQEILNNVSVYMNLPHEVPILATIKDTSQLSSKPFYRLAETGDKVLIFKEAQKAILYRPKLNKIIDFTTVAQDIEPKALKPTATPKSTSVTPGKSPTPLPEKNSVSSESKKDSEKEDTEKAEPLKIALYNGVKTQSLTRLVEADLDKKTTLDFSVVARENAKAAYTEILVVTVNEKYQDQAEYIAEVLDGKVSKLPKNEKKPQADILIIIGNEYVKHEK